MKKAIILLIVVLSPLVLHAQGTVNFNNRTALGTSHVWAGFGTWPPPSGPSSNDSPSGTADYAGAGYVLIGANGLGGQFGAATTFAQLLAANGSNQAESSLTPMGQTTTFRTGTAAGSLAGITTTLAGIPADAPWATLELVVWDNSSGLYSTWAEARLAWLGGLITAGKSGAFNVANIGGSINSPPNLLIPTFAFGIPEPGTVVLASLGVAAMLIFRRRKI